MRKLNFKGHSTTEWRNVKHFYHERFWEELHAKTLKDAKKMIQEQIYEEFDMQIGAECYQRCDSRQDKRNGTRYRSYEILGGYIQDLKIPRARKLDIRFSVFDMWERVQSKVLKAMIAAYLLGKSARCAQDIIEAFGQSRFSKSFLQRLVKNFEQRLKRYRQRKITKPWPYVFIDGMAVKMYDVYFKDKIVIFAMGMDNERNTELLGWVIADTEDDPSTRSLLIDLRQKGLIEPELFISDDSKGIKAALKLEYPHVPWQLCAFHKVKNINDHLIDRKNRKDMLREAGDIYQLSNSKKDAVRRFHRFRKNWKHKEPEAVRLFSQGFEHTLRYFEFPKHMRVSLYTNNPLEQRIGKIRDWLARFNYFQGKTNLELAIFTYICYKDGELVPELENKAIIQKDTLLVA